MITLRPEYQQPDYEAIQAFYDEGYKSVLYVLPTGGGKTPVFLKFVEEDYKAGRRVLILVHRDTLLRQASKHLTKLGIPHGLIKPGEPMTSHLVQVGSVWTVNKRRFQIRKPYRIISDEAHHCAADTWGEIFEVYPDALLLGVTATPNRPDRKGLGKNAGGYFDVMHVSAGTPKDLVKWGYLVAPRIFVPPTSLNLAKVKLNSYGTDFDAEELAAAVAKSTITGDLVKHYQKYCPGKRALVFTASVALAEETAAAYNAVGITAAAVSGKMSQEDQQRVFAAFEAGKILVVCSCDLISEGFDVPAAVACIMGRPTLSLVIFLQQVGRVMRIDGGKLEAFLIDAVGNYDRHGSPLTTREWSLLGFSRVAPADRLILVTCPNCWYTCEWEPLCPDCGCPMPKAYVNKGGGGRELKQVAGELVEIAPEVIVPAKEIPAAMQKQTLEQAMAKARSRADFQQIAKDFGFSPGWAQHAWLRVAGRFRRRGGMSL